MKNRPINREGEHKMTEIERQILHTVKTSYEPYQILLLTNQFDESLEPTKHIQKLLWNGYLRYVPNSLNLVETVEAKNNESPYEIILDMLEESSDKTMLKREVIAKAYVKCDSIIDAGSLYPVLRDLAATNCIEVIDNTHIKLIKKDMPDNSQYTHPFRAFSSLK